MMGSGQGLSPILRQIGRTALLAGALGLLLWGGLTLAAGWPGAPLALAAALSLPLALLTAWQVLDGWRAGAFPQWQGGVLRSREPFSYWFSMAWFGLCAFALLALAGWALLRLAGWG